MEDPEEIERQLVRIEERIARIPVLREYYCSVILGLTFNRPTPRILKWMLVAHIVLFVLLIAGIIALCL